MRTILLLIFVFIYNVSKAQDFGFFASAAYLYNSGNWAFYNCDGHGTANQIGSIEFSGDLGTFIEDSGELLLGGGEIKTWRGNGSNVCSPLLRYNIYLQSGTPGSYTGIALNFFCNCSGGMFPCGGGGCSGNDQKWQTTNSIIDLTDLVPGNYVLRLYYEVPGQSNGGGCSEIVYDNNNGSDYLMTFSIQGALPVNFIAFTGKKKDETTLLEWVIAEEVNCNYYEVMKSMDGKVFEAIGTIPSRGWLRSLSTYSYEDAVPKSAITYYKIKQVDMDGRSTYSKIIQIDPSFGISSIKLAPNPASSTIAIMGIPSDNIPYKISDYLGRVINEGSFKNDEMIDVSYLTKGVYYLMLSSQEGQKQYKFIKI